MKHTPYLIIGNLPDCSAVLFVNNNLEDPYRITIHLEHTREHCQSYVHGFTAGSRAEFRGHVDLPRGNPATSYAALTSACDHRSDMRTFADGHLHCVKCHTSVEVINRKLIAV